MLSVGLVVSAGAGLSVAVLGGPIGAVVLAGVLNLMAALGRLSFESMVQRDAPGANQGRAFARFETRFQLAWAVGAFIAVAIQVTGASASWSSASAAGATMLYLIGRRRTGDGDFGRGSVLAHPGEPEAGRLDLVRRRHGAGR